LLAVVGAINIPIIYFSVRWWNTLHQSFSVQPGQTQQLLDPAIKWGMLITSLGLWMYAIAIVLYRVRTIILEREKQTSWVQDLVSGKS
jgi:heme exporter protein C